MKFRPFLYLTQHFFVASRIFVASKILHCGHFPFFLPSLSMAGFIRKSSFEKSYDAAISGPLSPDDLTSLLSYPSRLDAFDERVAVEPS